MTKEEAAEQERSVLRDQALRGHEERIQAEMRRFRNELAHIESVYILRTGG